MLFRTVLSANTLVFSQSVVSDLWLPLTADYPPHFDGRLRGFPKFLENPFESVPRARDSGGFWLPRDSGGQNVAVGSKKGLGIRNVIDFGAESSRPTFSLSTLHSRRSPAVRQDSLPACLLWL